MDRGLWVWPQDPEDQERTLRKVASSPHLTAALQEIVKSEGGLSNSELDELLADNSNWMTLWSVRQLLALGFIDYKVDLFGGPARYTATEPGRNALTTVTGQPVQQKEPTPAPRGARPAAPETALTVL
jgi:hypothetical protein